MTGARHAEWLNLLEVSGPFLSLPVLTKAFPAGIAPLDSDATRRLRVAWGEYSADPSLHAAWLDYVVGELLGWPSGVADRLPPDLPPGLEVRLPGADEPLRPDRALLDPATGKPLVLVLQHPPHTPLQDAQPGGHVRATPVEQALDLARHTQTPFALVTNGTHWTLGIPAETIGASAGASGTVTWDADLWLEEPQTVASFAALLSAYRGYTVAAEDTFLSLVQESANSQAEVTDQLGRQVKAATELLVDALSRQHRDEIRRDGAALLDGVSGREAYAGALTVMMRLVFLLSAEERGLLLLGRFPTYDQHYAVSTLLGSLRAQADQAGEDVLDRRAAAWNRLLATFRLVHGGSRHEDMPLRPYGGSLLDPDTYPWLERARIPDRVVLRILDSLQMLRHGSGDAGAQRLSYRALDVEQIGHVYEGLLDHSCVRADKPHLGLIGKLEPEIALDDLEEGQADGTLPERLKEWTGLTVKGVEKALQKRPDAEQVAALRAACDNDADLADRCEPYWGLLRTDLRRLPTVFVTDAMFVTQTGNRRATGTHYTPRTLAEEVVRHTLDPLCFNPGPAQGADVSDWRVLPAERLLALRVADIAMGSGAFLVAACRYLAERLQEAWSYIEAPDDVPTDPAEQETHARRLVAQRCLYGVDRDPLAVEMAKLSLWLVTLARDRPFTFLDHALRRGDSLLGLTSIDQVTHLHPDPAVGGTLHARLDLDPDAAHDAVARAAEVRRRLETMPVHDVTDTQLKAGLLAGAEAETARLRAAADVVVGAMLSTAAQKGSALDDRLVAVAGDLAAGLAGDDAALASAQGRGEQWLEAGRPSGAPERECLHWPLEFPEIFSDGRGFDAVVGNPPFQGGQRITGALGTDYRDHLVANLADGRRGSADLVVYFFLRAATLAREGRIGLIATNTVAQGDSREVGLDALTGAGWDIIRAHKSKPWPTAGAAVHVSVVWLAHADAVETPVLDDRPVRRIAPSLDPAGRVTGNPERLAANASQSFIGSYVLGTGFTMSPDQAAALIDKDPRNADVLFPYLNGEDLNSRAESSASRWVINFHDWPLEKAEEYPDCIEIVRRDVKPKRDRNNRKNYRDFWWRYGEHRPGLYKAIEGLDRVLVITLTSRTQIPVFVPTGQVLSHMLVVFAYDDDAHLALHTSSIQYAWTLSRSSGMKGDLRYTPSDSFETFPQPPTSDAMSSTGADLDTYRRDLMLDRQWGLTTTYNHVHDHDEHDPAVQRLRDIHVAIDHAVADAYDWGDLDLDHGHHDTAQGVRFTIGPDARTEFLDRLLELNHARYADEVAQGLHDRGAKKRRSKRSADPDGGLF